MRIEFVNGKIGVEKLKRPSKDKGGLFHNPESDEFLGRVKFLDEHADYGKLSVKVGDKIFYSNQFIQMHMNGLDICVMDPSNVLAIVYEDSEEKPQT